MRYAAPILHAHEKHGLAGDLDRCGIEHRVCGIRKHSRRDYWVGRGSLEERGCSFHVVLRSLQTGLNRRGIDAILLLTLESQLVAELESLLCDLVTMDHRLMVHSPRLENGQRARKPGAILDVLKEDNVIGKV